MRPNEPSMTLDCDQCLGSSYLSRLKLLEQRISHLDQTMQALCTEGSELRRALEEADRLPKPVGKVGRAFSRNL